MVVFFDIDGTVVDNDTQIIPESAIRAVEQLEKNGHIAVVNTGRPFAHIDPRVRAMPFSGWICGCGMEIRVGDTWIRRTELTPQLRRHVFTAIRECGMQTFLESAAGDVFTLGSHSRHPHVLREMEQMTAKGVPIREAENMEDPPFTKGVTFDWPGCDREGFLRRLEPYFTCILRENTLIEFVPKGCSKAEGMAALLAHLGISREETLAIGDSTNDMPMFQAANHTACMGGGMEELKAAAEYITAPVLEDGIEKALHHFGLI